MTPVPASPASDPGSGPRPDPGCDARPARSDGDEPPILDLNEPPILDLNEPPILDLNEPPILPDQTRDESDVGWGGASWRDPLDDDERFLRERPPHWG
jgi:hypothetical protein